MNRHSSMMPLVAWQPTISLLSDYLPRMRRKGGSLKWKRDSTPRVRGGTPIVLIGPILLGSRRCAVRAVRLAGSIGVLGRELVGGVQEVADSGRPAIEHLAGGRPFLVT